MKPLGRKMCRIPIGKWKVKINGKHVEAWWEDICQANKTAEKQKVKKQLQSYL